MSPLLTVSSCMAVSSQQQLSDASILAAFSPMPKDIFSNLDCFESGTCPERRGYVFDSELASAEFHVSPGLETYFARKIVYCWFAA